MNEDETTQQHVESVVDKTTLAISHQRKETGEIVQSTQNAIGACVDAMQYAMDGELWTRNTYLSINLDLEEETFPYGSHVTFIPSMRSSDEEWRFVITLTKEVNNPRIGGTLEAGGRTTDEGTEVSVYKIGEMEMSNEQIILGLQSLTIAALTAPRTYNT